MDTCLKWSPDTGTWEEYLTLDVGREKHISWTPDTGVGTYLIGGVGSGSTNTSTLITPSGTQETGFEVENYLSQQCAIPDTDSVVITGGGNERQTVSRYNVLGWQEDLPPLNQGRYDHACAAYISDGRRVRNYEI